MMDYAAAIRKFNNDAYALCKLAMRDPSVGSEDRDTMRRMCGETDRLVDQPAPKQQPERITT